MSHTNSPQIIHQNKSGYVAKCGCCDSIQLCIGTTVLSMPELEFLSFKTAFFKLNSEYMERIHSKGLHQRYFVYTGYNDLCLSLTKKDFDRTADLLNTAAVILSAKRLLNETI